MQTRQEHLTHRIPAMAWRTIGALVGGIASVGGLVLAVETKQELPWGLWSAVIDESYQYVELLSKEEIEAGLPIANALYKLAGIHFYATYNYI